MYLKKYKKETKKRSATLPRHQSVYILVCAPRFRIYFMFAWSVCAVVCMLQLPADSSKRLPCAAAGFILC